MVHPAPGGDASGGGALERTPLVVLAADGRRDAEQWQAEADAHTDGDTPPMAVVADPDTSLGLATDDDAWMRPVDGSHPRQLTFERPLSVPDVAAFESFCRPHGLCRRPVAVAAGGVLRSFVWVGRVHALVTAADPHTQTAGAGALHDGTPPATSAVPEDAATLGGGCSPAACRVCEQPHPDADGDAIAAALAALAL